MYKILTIVGARPHFVKAAMVSKAIESHPNLHEVIVHTGQHYDRELSENFFEELALPQPVYRLGIGSGRAAWQMGQMIIAIDEVLAIENPDIVIVYGDTNTTAAGAIAAAKNNIPLAHIEAGLREFNKQIPEEVNKLLTDSVTDLFFCPTSTAVDNLEKMGITKGVHWVGDVGIDLLLAFQKKIQSASVLMNQLQLLPRHYYLLTCHRAANTNSVDPLKNILEACTSLDKPVVFPIHPRTAKAIDTFHLNHYLDGTNIIRLQPLGFWDLQRLLSHAKMAITDSGGIIKEAYFHKVPAIIIDQQTEWIETVEEGWNQISGPDTQRILGAISNFKRPTRHSNCFGDGTAAKKTVALIAQYLSKT
jgi:UDP-GlcNAc3NAcA epimerase